MRNTAKAYLKTEGKLGYRDCEICYYTYNMCDLPAKFMVNVNVCLQHTKNNYIKSLALNESFDQDEEAINFGIIEGKKYIDKSYELGKVKIVKPDADKKKANPATKAPTKPPTKPEKQKTQRSGKT